MIFVIQTSKWHLMNSTTEPYNQYMNITIIVVIIMLTQITRKLCRIYVVTKGVASTLISDDSIFSSDTFTGPTPVRLSLLLKVSDNIYPFSN